jgi:hypothetical protein
MIRYALRCDRGHDFEAWFGSIADYDRTAVAGENACPLCGSTAVEKALMAPAVSARTRSDHAWPEPKSEKVALAAPDPRQAAFRQALKEFRRKLIEGADYVGDRFAEEARKIHYNEAEPHGIYGEATAEEAKGLAEEGVAFQPLPPLPEDRN